MRSRDRRGFTLVELLVVIVIIALLLALLLPALVKALCNARQGVAEQMVEQLATAAKMYETDWALYPPGDGKGSSELASYLSKKNPKKQSYMDFNAEMLAGTNIANPVWAETPGPEQIIYYRNNVGTPAGSGGGGGGGGMPQVYNSSSVDIWCAGCSYVAGGPATSMWAVNNWE